MVLRLENAPRLRDVIRLTYTLVDALTTILNSSKYYDEPTGDLIEV
jgi:hypothetical protein